MVKGWRQVGGLGLPSAQRKILSPTLTVCICHTIRFKSFLREWNFPVISCSTFIMTLLLVHQYLLQGEVLVQGELVVVTYDVPCSCQYRVDL